MKEWKASVIVAGEACAPALCSRVPLSFWGGVDPHTGKIIDVHHDLKGQCITGKVLLIPAGRGSCSGSGIMLEMIRERTAPAALISIEAEPIISLGSVMGYELYKRGVPIFTLDESAFFGVPDGALLHISTDGKITLHEEEKDESRIVLSQN